MKKLLSAVILITFSSLANAHPGHGLEGLYAGFMHPLTGWDHLLVMLAVGVWAAKLGGQARWQLPLTFVSVMAIGAGLGMAGLRLSGVETAIAASVMAMGLLLLINLPFSLAIRLGLTALFALFHGLAHGVELSLYDGLPAGYDSLAMQSKLAGFAGMLLATALLHTTGILLGSSKQFSVKNFQGALGWCMLAAGAFYLIP